MSIHSFISEQELAARERYINQGFITAPITNILELNKIQNKIINLVSSFLNINLPIGNSATKVLDSIHHHLHNHDQLNLLRLHIIEKINQENWFRKSFYELVKESIEKIVGNELAMQLRINLSIQIPGDESSLLPIHSDTWSGDSPYEVVAWLPLVDCYGTKTMYLLPPDSYEKNLNLETAESLKIKTSNDLFKLIKDDLVWPSVKAGEYMIFNQNLPHGNQVNLESETRWTLNCRFKSIFSPYADKKNGEFFEPISLKAASEIGMKYTFPRIFGGIK
jgi:sporadic carbohydrate cluster 2OG-Fe(II) oxygenase